METQLNKTEQDVKHLFLSAKAAKAYVKDLKLNNIVFFENCSHSVIKITDEIVCKLRPCNEREKVLSLRDALVTSFLVKNNAPVVPFWKGLPIFPVICNNFLISFRKYIVQQHTIAADEVSYLKGTGRSLANCHAHLKLFSPSSCDYSELSWNIEDSNKETLFPNIYHNLALFRKADLSKVSRRYCSGCLTVLQKFQLLVDSKLDKLDLTKGQFLHGDFHILNTLRTRTEIIVNDLEMSSFGPIEYDCGTFLFWLLRGRRDLFTKDIRKVQFLSEYKYNGGLYEEDLISWVFEMQVLKHALRCCPIKCNKKKPSVSPF